MKSVKELYDQWSCQYDKDVNRTRDLEALVLENLLCKMNFNHCLELGCGTGKNTEWLLSISKKVLAIDFSNAMLEIAIEKIHSSKVRFLQADLNKEWTFAKYFKFDLITFSLVLEHIENLESIFTKLNKIISDKGLVYICELHPYRQYNGSKARYTTEQGIQTISSYTHNVSDYIKAAKENSFTLMEINEHFDDDNRTNMPRLLSMLFKKECN